MNSALPKIGNQKPEIEHKVKQIIFHFILLVAFTGFVYAQEKVGTTRTSQLESHMEVGAEMEGIRSPYYDEEGNLKAQIYGGYAKILDEGLADITNLRLDVFDDGKIVMTVFAPQCFSRMVQEPGPEGKKSFEAYSDGDVLIEMDQITIIGRGFRFLSENNRFEILSESKVLVKESARALKEPRR